jgi:glycosyltransferase involved in cell wall biosynthesis
MEGDASMTPSSTLNQRRLTQELDRANRLATASYRVRAVARFDACAARGGGEVQMSSTLAALGAADIDARAWRPWDDDEVRAGDIVHFFGSRPEFIPLVEAMRSRGAKTVLSTIAWFDWRNIWREPQSLAARVSATARYAIRSALPSIAGWRRRLYHGVDLLLPNSQAEAEQLLRLFQVPPQRIRVVPNGVEERFAAADSDLIRRRLGSDPFVLCVGRIEPRKNQLSLIRALRHSGLKLVVIGAAAPGHDQYFEACRLAADENVRFLGHVDRNDPLLASAYATCQCLALTSWYETPSLAALEAAMTGTPLVLPSGGCAREYFGSLAAYVAPHDLAEIRRTVLRAAGQSRSRELAELVRSQFTWQAVADATKAAYESL